MLKREQHFDPYGVQFCHNGLRLNKNQCFLSVFFDPRHRKSLPYWKSDKPTVLSCRPQHLSGRPNAPFSFQEALLAARKVLWPAWEHCCVVRFPSGKGCVGVWGHKNVQKALCFIGSEAIMAESESSSSILSTWLAYEHEFEKVVLWPTPNAINWHQYDRPE